MKVDEYVVIRRILEHAYREFFDTTSSHGRVSVFTTMLDDFGQFLLSVYHGFTNAEKAEALDRLAKEREYEDLR